ncbi:hypothetical protein VTK73DRAFT_8549 [Phialemonium thermophilum]|uniref:Laccase n=1 Tax=Phialemonium thermophilum TaxID=223376 RepID=A0ABR3XP97_9PEZI
MGLSASILQNVWGETSGIVTALSQEKTNGKSVHGTLLAPLLPMFLLDSPMPHGFPWGNATDWGHDPYKDPPNTGVTRTYDFTISRGVIAPDGYQKKVLLVNGAYPGPLIEANWGDSIVVTVHNNITDPEEGTGIHWHGFLQTYTPWEDGVPGVTQCPISPGKSFTYEFQASLFGSSWYHAHYSGQLADGVLGPIVVYGPSKFEHGVIDIGPVLLSDWYHDDYLTIVKRMLAPGGSPMVYSDNTLINGKMNFDCSTVAAGDKTHCTDGAGISKFRFQTGRTHRLRLVNTGASGDQRFSIDDHTMTVIANDFVPIVPYETRVVTLGVGQRSDVLVRADAGGPRSSFWIRSNQTRCSLARQPNAVAALYYDQADTDSVPTSTPWPVPDQRCTNDDLARTEPLFPMPLPRPSFTKTMDIELFVNESGVTLWSFDGQDYRGNYNAPPLLLANLGNFSFPPEWNIKDFGDNSSVRIIVNNHTPGPHPMHIHGYNFYVLHEGPGPWDGTIVRPQNPMRRDVAIVGPSGHLVVQFDSNNPGVWPFHCHTAWHASGGFFSSFLVRPDLVRQYQIPPTLAQTCRDWAAWTRTHVPDQIDSGQ